MTFSRHGLSIGIERVDNCFFMTFKAVGKLTHEDYQTIIPMIDSALEGVTGAQVNALVDASELEGWELRAAWDDLKIGLKHGREFKRIAIVSNSRWFEVGAKISAWFVAAELQVFEEDAQGFDAALGWLNSPA